MAKEIQLTQGKVAIVDDEDFEYLNQWKWYANNNYAIRSFTVSKSKVLRISMHREIMKPQKGFVIDHLDATGTGHYYDLYDYTVNWPNISVNDKITIDQVRIIDYTLAYEDVSILYNKGFGI